ncbi:MAG: hypothetical protein ACREM3_21970 [Candidatus Rokuibacteriota bacterium]
MPMLRGDCLRGSSPVLTATVLMGLLAMDSAPPAIAHEVKNQKETGATMNRRVPGEAPFDAAIRMLFCLEAREAVDKGQLDREGQQWILMNAHRCQDDRLLFDALGF